jgi:general secretion pathway protein G
MHNSKSKAFTLVELIVVIVILAILATIAFLSFSSQSASARDSTRLSDMSNIAKWLSVFNAVAGTYPKPDSPVSITASGTPIWQQWYAGLSVLNMIKISNWWKDPLDTTTYYTYSVNSNSSKFQILGFLEDSGNSALSIWDQTLKLSAFGYQPLAKTFADPSSYSGRYVMTKWDILGILLQSWTLLPIQSNWVIAWNSLDVENFSSWYQTVLSANEKISWSVVSKNDQNLVWLYHFNEIINSNQIKDSSQYSNTWYIYGTWWHLPEITAWKIWNWLYFDWVWDYLEIANNWYDFDNNTIVLNINTKKCVNDFIIDKRNSSMYPFNILCWNNKLYTRFYNNPNSSVLNDNISVNTNINIISVKDHLNMNLRLYINWKKISVDYTFTWTTNNTEKIQMWRYYMPANWATSNFYNWMIDEVRIYNKAISDLEAQSLYNTYK